MDDTTRIPQYVVLSDDGSDMDPRETRALRNRCGILSWERWIVLMSQATDHDTWKHFIDGEGIMVRTGTRKQA